MSKTPASQSDLHTGFDGASASGGTRWFQLGIVCAASFVVWSGFGAILPYLPVFLKEQAHASIWLIGFVASAYYIGTCLFSALLGRLSDRVGRKPMIVVGVSLTRWRPSSS